MVGYTYACTPILPPGWIDCEIGRSTWMSFCSECQAILRPIYCGYIAVFAHIFALRRAIRIRYNRGQARIACGTTGKQWSRQTVSVSCGHDRDGYTSTSSMGKPVLSCALVGRTGIQTTPEGFARKLRKLRRRSSTPPPILRIPDQVYHIPLIPLTGPLLSWWAHYNHCLVGASVSTNCCNLSTDQHDQLGIHYINISISLAYNMVIPVNMEAKLWDMVWLLGSFDSFGCLYKSLQNAPLTYVGQCGRGHSLTQSWSAREKRFATPIWWILYLQQENLFLLNEFSSKYDISNLTFEFQA